MFGWRKRNEGFEWREYVRTTILVRREKRRQHIEELREAAINKVKEAGERGVRAGAMGADKVGRAAKAGLAEAGRSLGDMARDGAGWLGESVARGSGVAGSGARAVGELAARLTRPALAFSIERHETLRRLVLTLAGMAAFWAAARFWGHGADGEARLAAFVALASLGLAGLIAMLAAERGSGLAAGRDRIGATLSALPRPGGRAFAAAAAVAVASAAGWMWMPRGGGFGIGQLTDLSGFGARSPGALGGNRAAGAGRADTMVTGRAVAVAGDTIRVAGQRVRLAAIEAPERDQKCIADGGRTWACGSAAVQALAARISSRPVRCEVSKGPEVMHGTCTVDGNDLAAALVRGGHVFAETGWFARYAAEEAEARDAKTGVWRGGEAAERPEEYRSKRWEEARRAAPDGCPIKGQKPSSDKRVYVLPWSPQYDRLKVRTARGERWFCSEAEAQAAGWTPMEKS